MAKKKNSKKLSKFEKKLFEMLDKASEPPSYEQIKEYCDSIRKINDSEEVTHTIIEWDNPQQHLLQERHRHTDETVVMLNRRFVRPVWYYSTKDKLLENVAYIRKGR